MLNLNGKLFFVLMASNSKILLFTNRKWFKDIKFLFMASIMIGVSLFFVVYKFENPVENFFGMVLGIIGLTFFGICTLSMLYTNIKYKIQGRDLVMITPKGLMIRDRFVAWENIKRFSNHENYIVVLTNNIEKRMNKDRGLKRILNKLNLRIDGSDIYISDWDYDGTSEEFIQKCNCYSKNAYNLTTPEEDALNEVFKETP